MTDPTTDRHGRAAPAVLLLALMMLAQTLCDGTNDLARANMFHGVSVLFGGALVATGWFRGHRGWLFLYAPLAVALALAGTPDPQSGPARLKIGLIILYTGVSVIGMLRLLPRAPWLRPART